MLWNVLLRALASRSLTRPCSILLDMRFNLDNKPSIGLATEYSTRRTRVTEYVSRGSRALSAARVSARDLPNGAVCSNAGAGRAFKCSSLKRVHAGAVLDKTSPAVRPPSSTEPEEQAEADSLSNSQPGNHWPREHSTEATSGRDRRNYDSPNQQHRAVSGRAQASSNVVVAPATEPREKDIGVVQMPSSRRRRKGAGRIMPSAAPPKNQGPQLSNQHLQRQQPPANKAKSKPPSCVPVDLLRAIAASEAAASQHVGESHGGAQRPEPATQLPQSAEEGKDSREASGSQAQHDKIAIKPAMEFRPEVSDSGSPAGDQLTPKDARAREAHAVMQRALAAEASLLESCPEVASDREGGEADEKLDVAFNQLPRWWNSRTLDWSGTTDYTALHKQALGPQWSPNLAEENLDLVDVEVEGELVSVLPMWIAVHQESSSNPARLYESIFPLDDGIVANLAQPLEAFCDAQDLTFSKCDDKRGAWHNYCIGIVGHVANMEHEVLWPNQVLHGNRTMYNVRNGSDLARFLADPVKEDMEAHLQNLRVLQEERGYKEGWCYMMLRTRWGSQALKDHGIVLKPSTSSL